MAKDPVEDIEEEIEDLDDDDLEELESKKIKKPMVRSPSQPQSAKMVPRVIKKRYGIFAQAARLGIADNETGEVVGEGDIAVLSTLCEILERLERIEDNLGSFTGK